MMSSAKNANPATDDPRPESGSKSGPQPSEGEVPVFALYVSKGSHWSDAAETLVHKLCEHLRRTQECKVNVINVNSEASGALANRVFVTPTLIKLSPPPQTRLVGQFTDPEVVERFLRSGGE